MTIDPAEIDYTDADYAALRKRLVNVAQSQFPGWDGLGKHIGNLLLEADSWAFDIAARYQEVQAAERFLPTARRRENVELWARHLGYSVQPRIAARYVVTVTLVAVPVNDVQIDIGHQFYSSGAGARTLEAIQSALILAGTNPPTADVLVEDSTSREDTESSSDLPEQEVLTSGRPLLDTIIVLADNGAYSLVSSFTFSSPSDLHATISVRDDERVVVRFGDGQRGKIPTGTITIAYRVGGGIAGNLAPGAIKQIAQVLDVLNNPVAASCANAAGPYVVGRERETIAEIKRNAPASVRVTDRTVGSFDYATRAESISGVARAMIFTSNEIPGAIPENTGYLYVVPTDIGTPSQALLDQVLTTVTEDFPNTITFEVVVLPAAYRTIDVRAVVYFKRGQSPTTVTTAIRSALADLFVPLLSDLTPNPEVDFGYNLDSEAPAVPLHKVLCAIQDTAGVAKVGDRDDDFLLNGEHTDIALAPFEWPRLGNVIIINAATGQQMP